MLPAEDLAGALAFECYSRAAELIALAEHDARDEGCAFTQIQEKMLYTALAAAMDGCEASFRASLTISQNMGAQ